MKEKKMMKAGLALISCGTLLVGCGQGDEPVATQESASSEIQSEVEITPTEETVVDTYADATQIALSDDKMTVDGVDVTTDDTQAVYIAHDIVYYEDGKDFTYGEGTQDDAHTEEEAEEQVVVHITQAGDYHVSGTLSAGQIAVDLGEDAAENPDAVVTLILDNADISCAVAPAVIFYNVYECGLADEEAASMDVDTSAAGANVIIADGSINNISGSYVAKIYKSYELNDEGTEVVDSKKLHKYDGAFYSKMSMNVDGGKADTGILNITAENEGLDSEMHLTINGGNINITSGNDGINTNEDGVSVTTINGGNLNIVVDGSTGEGDGIDSNGWIVFNGGTVRAAACASSADAGIDSDKGIYMNGGTIIATGNMLDEISDGTQNYIVLGFASRQTGGTNYFIKDEDGNIVLEDVPANDFSYLIYSDADLNEGTYSVWMKDTQLCSTASEKVLGVPQMDEVPQMGEAPQNGEKPEEMEKPDSAEKPEKPERSESEEKPEGMEPSKNNRVQTDAETTEDFVVNKGGNYYSNVGMVSE